jgi:hypothetical protein
LLLNGPILKVPSSAVTVCDSSSLFTNRSWPPVLS